MGTAQTKTSTSSAETHDTGSDINLAELVRIILRRKTIFLATFIAIMALAIGYIAVVKWKFRAESELQVLKEDSSSSITDLISSAGGAGDALSVNLTLQTYVGVLTSDNLALRVIHELKLEDTPEYGYKPGIFASKAEKDEANLPLEETRFRRSAILKTFQKNLKVSVVAGTRLIDVDFLSTDPVLAKRVLNQLLSDFIEYNFQVRYKATERSADWLGRQLVDLKANVEQAQTEAARLQRETGIFGSDETHNIVLSRLEALNQQLISAEQNRIVKDAVRQVVKSGDPELISNLSGTAGQSLTPTTVNSLALIQTLRQQEAALNGQYADLTTKFGPNYPRVIEVRDQIAAIHQSIQKETDRVQERANSDYKIAVDQEKAIQTQFDEQKALANKTNDLSIQFGIAKEEASSSRTLYESLLEKLKESGVLAGLRSTNIDVVDVAHVGALPASPNIGATIGLGIVFGCILGLSAVFLRDSLDRSLYKPEDVEVLTSLALLGVVPLVQGEELTEPDHVEKKVIEHPSTPSQANPISYMASTHPNSQFAEALRTIRTAMLLSVPDRRLQTIMVTSPLPHEGKSTIASNLASIMAQQGKKVLLVDADMRRGTLSKNLGVSSSIGLSQFIATQDATQAPVHLDVAPNLYIVPCGTRPPYPAELLASDAAVKLIERWRTEYDFIIFDTPPVLPITDAVAFSSRMDGVILVSRAAVTTKQSFMRSFRLLDAVQAPLLGAVFNAMDIHSSEYAYFSGYYQYNSRYGYSYGGYGYGEESAKKKGKA